MESILNCVLVTGGDMSANVSSGALKIGRFQAVSLQALWTGTPTGTIKLQVSNDTGDSPTNWTDYTGSSSSTGGAAGSVAWNLSVAFRWIQVVYTSVSGSGSLTVNVHAKAGH